MALGFAVKEQLHTQIIVEGKIIGRYFLDFLISDKNNDVVLELKVADQVYPQHIRQVLGYLKANKLKLGIIGVYTTQGVKIKHVINCAIGGICESVDKVIFLPCSPTTTLQKTNASRGC